MKINGFYIKRVTPHGKNSSSILIPKDFLKKLNLINGDLIKVSIYEEDKIIIKKIDGNEIDIWKIREIREKYNFKF